MIAVRKDPLLGLNKLQTKMGVAAGHVGTPETLLLDSQVLFAGGSEVMISHGFDRYRLRVTRQNKLILTK